MKDSKFIPIAGQPETGISYNAEVVGQMNYVDFSKSSLASLLFAGQQNLPDGYKDKYLKAWHEDATRIYGESKPKEEPKPDPKAEKNK